MVYNSFHTMIGSKLISKSIVNLVSLIFPVVTLCNQNKLCLADIYILSALQKAKISYRMPNIFLAKYIRQIEDTLSPSYYRGFIIQRIFSTQCKETFLKFYLLLVHSMLVNTSCVLSPYIQHDIQQLETVQTCFVKTIVRFISLGLFSFEAQCLRFDLIQVFRIVHSIDDIGFESYFTKNQYKSSRGHQLNIQLLP